MERFAGTDALLWHLEWPGNPCHTLKTAVLDPSRLGRQLTPADLRAALEPRLGLLPRLTQRVQAARRFRGRPFWVPDPEFDLDRHLDEIHVSAPGGRAELDELHSRLAATPLDRSRPLWAATLVHGLEGGRQAVVVRIHHAVADGQGALNSFLALTGDAPGTPVPTAPRPAPIAVSDRELQREVLRQVPGLLTDLVQLLVSGAASARRARRLRRAHPDLPAFLGSSRTFTSTPSGSDRICVSYAFDFADIRAVSKAAGVTVNGLYHALIAAALRDELLRRGEDTSAPMVAAFAIGARDAGAERHVQGNFVTPTNVNMFSNLDDPLERLAHTGQSCRDGVELRKMTGVQMAGRWAVYTCRLAPLFVKVAKDRSPKVVNHVTTANVPGPATTRWAGPVEVVDWVSFALAAHPANLNITAYSYAGRLSIGLITTPEVLPEPQRFLARMEDELGVLKKLLVDAPSQPVTSA